MSEQLDAQPLAEWIRQQILERGPVTVAQFMEWALYHPIYGYYTRGPHIGPRGDFTTSPEASPAFGRLLARHVEDIDALLGHPATCAVIECGPGRGTLASGLLDTLATRNPNLYSRLSYWLIEISPALKQAQQERLTARHASTVRWAGSVADLPPGFRGAVLANEFVDAFPVHVLQMRAGTLMEQYVTVEDDTLKVSLGAASNPQLTAFVERYDISLDEGEQVEVNPGQVEWLRQTARVLDAGVLTAIDYGDTQRGRYSEARRQGTLLGYYAGTVTHDILAHPGEQDLTALVDFTALQDDALHAGFDIVGLTRQAAFLVGLGLGTDIGMAGEETEVEAALSYRRGLQSLISMEGLGKFHVLVASKGLDAQQVHAQLSGLKYAGML